MSGVTLPQLVPLPETPRYCYFGTNTTGDPDRGLPYWNHRLDLNAIVARLPTDRIERASRLFFCSLGIVVIDPQNLRFSFYDRLRIKNWREEEIEVKEHIYCGLRDQKLQRVKFRDEECLTRPLERSIQISNGLVLDLDKFILYDKSSDHCFEKVKMLPSIAIARKICHYLPSLAQLCLNSVTAQLFLKPTDRLHITNRIGSAVRVFLVPVKSTYSIFYVTIFDQKIYAEKDEENHLFYSDTVEFEYEKNFIKIRAQCGIYYIDPRCTREPDREEGGGYYLSTHLKAGTVRWEERPMVRKALADDNVIRVL